MSNARPAPLPPHLIEALELVPSELFDALLEAAGADVYVKDREGRYLFLNRPSAIFQGRPPGEVIGKTDAELLPPEQARLRRAHDLAALEADRSLEVKEALGQAEASRVYLTIRAPLRDRRGEVVGMLGLSRDTTEEDERFLSEASALLGASLDYEVTLSRLAELALSRLGDWCAVDMLEGGLIQRVAAAHRQPEKRALMLDLARRFPTRWETVEDHRNLLAGRTLFLPEFSEARLAELAENAEHLAGLRALNLQGCMALPLEVRGQVVGVLSIGRLTASQPLRESDLKLARELARRAAGAIENVRLHREVQRARAEAEAAARRSNFLAEASELLTSSLEVEQTIQAVVRLLVPELADTCLVLLRDEDGMPRWVADAARDAPAAELIRQIRELTPRQPLGHPVGEVFESGQIQYFSDYDAYMGERSPQETAPAEHEVLTRALGLGETLIVPLLSRGRTLGVLAMAMIGSARHYAPEDVTLVSDLARQVGQAVENTRLYRDAQRAIRLRDEFLSIASHELRTPLAALQLQVLSVLRAAQKGPESLSSSWVAGRTTKAVSSVDRLAGLIDNLLDVTRLSKRELELKLEPVELSALVRDVAERFSEQPHGGTVEVRAEAPLWGRWDRFRLEQVVTNLLANALKYGQGRPILVEVALAEAGAVLRVTDQGIGIPLESQERVFDRFERAVSTREYGGFGLGLWISRQIVEALGGRITVQSRPEQGATFTVELPRGEPEVDG